MKIIKTITALSLLFLYGCSDSGNSPTDPGGGGGGGGGTGVDTISFASDVRPLLQNNNCLNSGCHGTGSSEGELTLGTATYSSVRNGSGTNGSIVVASDASSSNLYLKVTSSPPFGSQMPVTGSKLSVTDQNKIRDWIDQGALDN